MTLPSPTDVAPAQDDVRLERDVRGERDRPSRGRPSRGRASSRRRACARSLSRTRRSHSACGELGPVVDAVEAAVVLERRRRSTIRPSSRASRTSSVRYSSPVVGDGSSAPIRRRSQAASNAYRPALTSLSSSSSSVASLASTIRSTVPNSLADDPPELGRDRRRRPLASAIAASSWRRCLEDGLEVGAGRRAARRRTGRGSRSTSSGTAASAAATASPVPRGSSWRANVGRGRAKASRTAAIGGRVHDDRRRRRAGRRLAAPTRRGRRRASAGRTAGGGPWARRRIRVPRPAARTTAVGPSRIARNSGVGTWRVHAGRRACVGGGRPGVHRARRADGSCHQVGRADGMGGSPRARQAAPSAPGAPCDRLDLDQDALRQRGDGDRRAGRAAGRA